MVSNNVGLAKTLAKINMNFNQKILKTQQEKNSLLCIGLDSDVNRIPEFLKKSKNPQLEFNSLIIQATKDLVCAYKLNLAFYEETGNDGMQALEKTLELIPEEVIKIADGKRGDIGNTAQKQADTLFKHFNFDAATVNPYMGFDAIEPFINYSEKGIFILCITSNPGSEDFQHLSFSGKPLFEHVALKAKKWNTKNNIGLVVGATHIGELKKLRTLLPEMPFLIPGIGVQKGDLEKTIKYGCSTDGYNAIINVGRSIIFPTETKNFQENIRKSAEKYSTEINSYRNKYYE